VQEDLSRAPGHHASSRRTLAERAAVAPGAVATLGEEPASDGRVARGQRTRRTVAEALVALLHEGHPDPTARAVAERAGVSLRLVFHHFSDIDDLYRAVAALQVERHWSALPVVAPTLALSTRIDRTVQHRSILYEEISPVRRAAVRRSGGSAEIAAAIAYTDGLLMGSAAAVFAPELGGCTESERIELLAAVDAASSWETWERLRRNSELPTSTAKRIMARTLRALLAERTPVVREIEAPVNPTD
jgi:TetR/AcrR family transcriptional regulator of autoinduction and epiphytic fitness